MTGKDKIQEDTQKDGDALWQKAMRGVKTYSPASAVAAEMSKKIKKTARRESLPTVIPAAQKPGAGFDRATAAKLKKGQLRPEGRLDLHGMTQAAAFDALVRFIARAVAEKKRTVLVITGKGKMAQGVLKRMLPLWLEGPELSPHVVVAVEAHIKDGGSGAFYVRLKKQK